MAGTEMVALAHRINMKILGNICVGLAGFLYLVPLQLMMSEVGRKRNDGGAVWGSIFVLAPLWILLTIAFLCVTARGGLDGFKLPRGPQYLLALVSGVALAVVTFFSVMGKVEHPNHLPW